MLRLIIEFKPQLATWNRIKLNDKCHQLTTRKFPDLLYKSKFQNVVDHLVNALDVCKPPMTGVVILSYKINAGRNHFKEREFDTTWLPIQGIAA
jgi:hypothetical protein